ncbi:hypothetical protein [uncultured Chitinophaga sp.]|uniref:hypothetical protein n=1 Tax=uncultured Chitinophaga sp. TaxID=339340 RepID=UPI0025F2FBDB|nr:hypothetical protein [uncultured Chitinophaga sp.]
MKHLVKLAAGLCLTLVLSINVNNSNAQTNSGKRKNVLYNITETGMLYGNETGISIKTVLGYRFQHKYSVGIGIGYQHYYLGSMLIDVEEKQFPDISVIPIFADVRYDLLDKKITPFIYGNAGFSHLVKMETTYEKFKQDKPGVVFEGGIGQKFSASVRRSFIISAGYQYSDVKGIVKTRFEAEQAAFDKYTFGRITFRVGLTL